MGAFLPCLLERWSTPASAPGGSRTSSWNDVRRDVLRNLEWLLNTEQPAQLAAGAIPPEVAKSTLCFGIPNYSAGSQSVGAAADIAWSIRERIVAFETRIEAATLNVSAVALDETHVFDRMRFSIHGYLRADPVPIEFMVQSELDVKSGLARIID